MVKEVARLGGRFEHCVPPPVVEAVREKIRQNKGE
jgi:phosphopantetheine adenylyltransferase